MKNIFKILLVFFLPLLLLNSCRDEADKDWTTPDASIKLYDSNLSSNILYPSMADNVFRLTWDPVANVGGDYTVQMSKTADFATAVNLGKGVNNVFTTKISTLNMALLQAGFSPYSQTPVFMRIMAGTFMSNVISAGVTPYPVDKPVITSPTAGQSIVLNGLTPNVAAATVKWTDYTYGVEVNYNVEIAPKGSTTFVSGGTVKDAKELMWTNFTLNDAVLKFGLAVGVVSEVQVRVTAKTQSAGGTISKTSDIVLFKVTPYAPAYVDFFLVGGGTAVGWNATSSQVLYKNNEVAEIYTYLNNNGDFRFLGQQDWNPINYSLNDAAIKDSYKFFNAWSANLQPSGDENIRFTGDSGMYKVAINQNSRAITVTPSSIPTLPTNVYLVGSIQGWNPTTALEMTQIGDGLYEYMIAIAPNSEFKFLGQQSWGDLEWANIHTDGNSGFLGPKGDNNNIKYNGTGGMYKITANIKLGTYKVTPQ
jgi:hypothetical protein